MRCKKHIPDPSSAVGVCASCLRERLFVLIDAQSQPLPLPPSDDDDRRSSGPKQPPHHLPAPPPLVFPRSVSPYISRRKSDTGPVAYDDSDFSVDDRKPRFFSTPQAGTTASSGSNNKKKKKSKFNLFSSLFRSGSAKSRRSSDPLSDPALSGSNSNLTASELHAYPSPSSSWIPCRRKPISRLSSLDKTSSSSTYDGRRNRGMSPDVEYDVGCSPDSWRRTPSSVYGSNRPSHARVPASPARSQLASGIGFCLSPLMRPSPGRHWKGKSTGLETGYSGEIRPAVKPHLSTAASLRASRSRKLADFGRFDHNR